MVSPVVLLAGVVVRLVTHSLDALIRTLASGQLEDLLDGVSV